MATDNRFVRCNGSVYTELSFTYEYWKDYLDVFTEVRVIARVKDVDRVPDNWTQSGGDGVRFLPVRHYLGFWQFLRRFPGVILDCRRALRQGDCHLLRMGVISTVCWFWLRLARRPYGYEVPGHASESVRRVKNVQAFGISALIGWITDKITLRIAGGAHCAAYVSRSAQGLYPTRRRDREWVFSSVRLTEDAVTAPRERDAFEGTIRRIVSVGRLEPEKGHAVLMQALAALQSRGGLEFEATIVGGGRELEALRRMGMDLELQRNVSLPGVVTMGPKLSAHLDRAHLFVLPSLTEGLPRALIEAMARGLPAIGTRVGGIPELLERPELVPPGDPEALADAIQSIIMDEQRLTRLSERNFKHAMNWHPDEMQRRKHAFWECIHATAESIPRGC